MIDPHGLPDLPELMIAGPGELHESDLEVLGHQVIAHYGEIWTQLHQQTLGSLAKLLGASSDPYLIPGSGTAALEMALINLIAPTERVTVTATGFFGDRLAHIATAVGLDVVMYPVDVGHAVDVEDLANVARGSKAIVTAHVETSTGVVHPIADIAGVAREIDGLCIVDAIASAGGEPISMEQMGIDALVTATQKGLEAPPGLGILALGERGKRAVAERESSPRSWYLDVDVWDRYRDEWGTWHPHPVTMPTNLVLALASSLKRILSEGDAWIEKRSALASYCREGLGSLGYEPVPQPGVGANLVVAAWAEDPSRIQKHLLNQGLMVSGGLGPTHDRAIRVGLMGRTATHATVARLLDALAEM